FSHTYGHTASLISSSLFRITPPPPSPPPTLSLHDALPISSCRDQFVTDLPREREIGNGAVQVPKLATTEPELDSTTTVFADAHRSEEHTSELQSRGHLVRRLLLEKKKNRIIYNQL